MGDTINVEFTANRTSQGERIRRAYISEDDWNTNAEKSLHFIRKLNAYYNDSSEYSWRLYPDSALCDEIIKYYTHVNPLDGYPGEIQAITIYDFFCKNDSLFKTIEYYMNKKIRFKASRFDMDKDII